MVEQIGHDLLKRCAGERIAQYIGEPKLEDSISLCRKYLKRKKKSGVEHEETVGILMKRFGA
jgi:hypothetical protein